eukprot:CAMPEP_0119073968 /NCGR_PEP_ID=MMETSP1178-20130426/70467_1 /TAXON_ID=33656 /ORGANISM="unid sp, Strain CCMP2000" /LENGTH=86 /DNA_ID=CAMNT_0007056095 /DNA_START=322 /DNA_END=578 /DNA_ORIENTATION=-
MPKLPLVYPSASVLPVREKSTPLLPFGGDREDFLVAAVMPGGDSLQATAVLVGAGASPKEKQADGVRKRRNASGTRGVRMDAANFP